MSYHTDIRPATRVAVMAAAGCVTLTGLAAIGTGVSIGGLANAAAATNAGNATVITPATAATPLVPLSTGGSATQFTLKLPDAAACTGDSANANYRVQSYMVPASVDPATLTFNSAGPVAVTGQFRAPLYDTTGSPYVNKQTSSATPPATIGPVQQPLPAFDYKVYRPGDIPPGTYNVGIACTLGPVSATQIDKYWNLQKVFAANAGDSPAQITWTFAAAAQATTTTTTAATTTTTTVAGSSTTSSTTASTTSGASSSTSSTVPATSSTSSTLLGSSTRASTTPSGGAADAGSGQPSAGAGAASAGTTRSAAAGRLAKTGGSFLVPLAWSFLLVWLGRMAVLLGRRPSRRADRQ